MCFLYPEIAVKYKEAIMPYHIFVGVLTFALSVVTSVLGFSEKIMFALYVIVCSKSPNANLICWTQEPTVVDGSTDFEFRELNINDLRRAGRVFTNRTGIQTIVKTGRCAQHNSGQILILSLYIF